MQRACVCDIRGHLAQQHLATNYKHTAASDYIYKKYKQRFLSVTWFVRGALGTKILQTSDLSLSCMNVVFAAFAGRIFADSLAPNWSPRRENSSSSKRRVAAACGFFIPLETPSFLLQNLISLMMWESRKNVFPPLHAVRQRIFLYSCWYQIYITAAAKSGPCEERNWNGIRKL